MGQPTPYSRAYSFTDYQTANPSEPLPGDQIDAELDGIERTLDDLVANIGLVQADDGGLASGVVDYDSLAADVKTLLANVADWNLRGDWGTGVDYAKYNLVKQSGRSWLCAVAHTSGTFSTDEAAGKWVPLTAEQGPAGPTGSTGSAGPAGPAGANGAFSVVASQAEAVSGTDNEKGMTPLRVKQHVQGNLASQSEAEAGADNTKIMTPLRVAQAIAALAATAIMPSGTVLPYAGTTAPSDFLLCDGSAVSRTTYAALFSVISDTFGAGDGSTTFNLPDLRGRIPVGKDNMGGSAADRGPSTTLGATGGSQYLQNHAHSVSITSGTPSGTDPIPDGGGAAHTPASASHTHSVSGNTGNPTSATVSQMNPYQIFNYIIKT